MKILLSIILIVISMPANSSCIILLHGLARTESSMTKMEEKLSNKGYQVINLGYSSREHRIEKLASLAIDQALDECEESAKINFVTHSLGGILVRQYLSVNKIPNLKHTVMLGPPNKGSEVVDKLRNVPGFHFLNGDAGLQLGTGESSIPNSLGPVQFDLGIIAGSGSINLILSTLIPGKDDGKVSIERTKIEGMNDHIVLATSHPFMMNNNVAISQVIYYLKNGKFKR